METIKDITVELSTKNLIVTYLDDRGNSTKRGFTHSSREDWEELENDEELVRYIPLVWEGISKPDAEVEYYDEEE